jgi:hypothetical protein
MTLDGAREFTAVGSHACHLDNQIFIDLTL